MTAGKFQTLAIQLELLAPESQSTTAPSIKQWEMLERVVDVLVTRLPANEAIERANRLPIGIDWLICESGANLYQRCSGQWIELKEYARNRPQPGPRQGGAAVAVSWWLRFTGRAANQAVVAVIDEPQLIGGDWRVILPANASVSVRRQAQNCPESNVYCAALPGFDGLKAGVEWFAMDSRNSNESPATLSKTLGATPITVDKSSFCVWAPRRKQVAVEVTKNGQASRHPLTRNAEGYHQGVAPASVGDQYRYALDPYLLRPDPASRFQPRSVHDHSEIVSSRSFAWSDSDWRGVAKSDLVIYEMHVGTFSQQGDYRGAIERIPYLVDLGVSAIELLPLAQSPGKWNWGYDGVNLFAPNRNYGRPDEFKALVDACHAAGLAVLLDVVYNHLGPEGNYLSDFGPYFSKKHHTPWGGAFNFDGWLSPHVRRLVVDNALYWLDEFHLDGLRLDAVHFMFDDSEPSILTELRRAVTAFQKRSGREVHLIAEANMFDETLLASANTQRDSVDAYDAIWCDCLMHSIYSLGAPELNLTYREFRGAADIAEALTLGYLYEMPNAPPEAGGKSEPHQVIRTQLEHRSQRHHQDDRQYIRSLVMALQTHDSVGNHPHGKRLHQLTSVEFQQSAAALFLLYPAIPMIFMGEETAAESPFPFFADFGDEGLRRSVDHGRAREYPQHQWDGALAPSDANAFKFAKCDLHGPSHPLVLDWYKRLLSLRKAGLADGWLDVKRLRVHSEVERGVFILQYDLEGLAVEADSSQASIWVVAQLTAPGADHSGAISSWQFPHAGEVLLDSRRPSVLPSSPATEPISPICLEANHAIVVRG